MKLRQKALSGDPRALERLLTLAALVDDAADVARSTATLLAESEAASPDRTTEPISTQLPAPTDTDNQEDKV